MSLHEDLCDLARRLVGTDTSEPSQADLRRAVSTAYYAVFHLLVDEAVAMIATESSLGFARSLVRRAFDHGDMRKASESFRSGMLPDHLREIWPVEVPMDRRRPIPVPDALSDIADAFAVLQEARHRADYKIDYQLTRIDAAALVDRAVAAIQNWGSVRSEPVAMLYLASLLLWKKWARDAY
jgi:hypothetical protein